MSYSVDTVHLLRLFLYVDRILKGEKPPICRCKHQYKSNWSSTSRPPRRSASTPAYVLARADEVIE